MPFFIVGMCLLGVAYHEKLNIAAVIFGWGMAEFGILLITVTIYVYLANTFPQQQGETASLINLARVLGGFGAYPLLSFSRPVACTDFVQSSSYAAIPFFRESIQSLWAMILNRSDLFPCAQRSRGRSRLRAEPRSSSAWRLRSAQASSCSSSSRSRSTAVACGTGSSDQLADPAGSGSTLCSSLFNTCCRTSVSLLVVIVMTRVSSLPISVPVHARELCRESETRTR